MAIFPNPEELYPEWRDWARVLGQYLVDEEMERRRDVSQRLGRFFINYARPLDVVVKQDLIFSPRTPFKIISCSNSWRKTTAGNFLTISKVTPPSTTVLIEWEHGTPATIVSPNTLSPSIIHGHTEGLCTANSEVAAGDVLQAIQFNAQTGGEQGFTIEAEDLSWGL